MTTQELVALKFLTVDCDYQRQRFFEIAADIGPNPALGIHTWNFTDVGHKPFTMLLDERRVFTFQVASPTLQRYVAVFLAGVGVALVFQGAEGGDDAGAGFGRLDDRVDIAAFGGDEGVGKAFAEFGNFFLA
jgi:hypothetical protein